MEYNFFFLRIFFKFFVYFSLHWVLVAACGLSLVALSRDCSRVAVRGLLTVVISLGEQKL